MLPPHQNENELFRDEPPQLFRYAEEGTVGWADDDDSVSHGNDETDGHTLVKVTLFDGHPDLEPLAKDGSANGHQILCRVCGPFWSTPARGTRVVILFPGGRMARANGVIVGELGPSPARRFGRNKSVASFAGKDVVIAARSVALVAEAEDEGGTMHRYVVSVSGQGGAQMVADGSGVFVKDGEIDLKALDDSGNLKTSLMLNGSEVSIMDSTSGSTATLTLKGGNVTMLGQFVSIIPGTAMKIGKLASPATPLLLGPSGFSAVPSTFIWGSVSP